jgi:hypothetical protein
LRSPLPDGLRPNGIFSHFLLFSLFRLLSETRSCHQNPQSASHRNCFLIALQFATSSFPTCVIFANEALIVVELSDMQLVSVLLPRDGVYAGDCFYAITRLVPFDDTNLQVKFLRISQLMPVIKIPRNFANELLSAANYPLSPTK